MAKFKFNADNWGSPQPLYEYREFLFSDGPDESWPPPANPSVDRKCRLIAVAALRAIWDELPDPRCRAAVELFEAFADDLDHAKNEEAESLARHAAEDAFALFATRRDDRSASMNEFVASKVRQAVGVDSFDPDDGPAFIRYSWVEVIEELHKEPFNLALLCDIFGNPFRAVAFEPEWRTSTVVALAQQMYESRDFSTMPILADALQDAGCDNDDILNHCRDANDVHVRGCWVVDLVLGKE